MLVKILAIYGVLLLLFWIGLIIVAVCREKKKNKRPFYCYICKKCGKYTLSLTSLIKHNDIKCPLCGGELKRVTDGK